MTMYLKLLTLVICCGHAACDTTTSNVVAPEVGGGIAEDVGQDNEDPTIPEGSAALAAILDLDLSSPANYSDPDLPQHYTGRVLDQDNAPADNPVTDEGATLGRVLFFDTQLSLNQTISCSSCHVQALGFTDSLRFSVGFEGGETGSHSMRLANANFYTGEHMFWDSRAEDLEDQSLQPVMDGVEMGFDPSAGGLAALVSRLQQTDYYPVLFEWAFGSADVTEVGMRAALAQYVRSMVSTSSRFDDGLAVVGPIGRGPIGDLPTLSATENLGLRVFTAPPPAGAGCAGCHTLPTFALDDASGSNGLDAGQTAVFKSPSLKNVAVAGPYMHDGRFATLLEVVEHYNSGVQNGPALDRRLRAPGGTPIRLNLSDEEKGALVAFLGTLTDSNLLADPKFSDPFVR